MGRKANILGGLVVAGALAVGADNLANYSENQRIAAADRREGDPGIDNPERVLSLEELRIEYDKADILRNIYSREVGTRRKISKTVRFALPAGYGLIKTKLSSVDKIGFNDLETLGIPKETFTPLVDLGAFNLEKLRAGQMNAEKLVEQGVKEVVLMEDHDPMFYLNYAGYEAEKVVPLNRHGEKKDQWTQADLKKLIDELHRVGIKVVIGFWGNTGNKDGNPFIKDNWDALRPVIPMSDDVNPLSFVKNQNGQEVPFGDYVVEQFARLKQDFGVDGLFLGDGLMGFRAFLDHDGPYDASSTKKGWTDFYKRIRHGIKAIDSQSTLWAYDCMGNGTTKARKNGLHLPHMATHIDRYVFQGYGEDAWGRDMSLSGYDTARDKTEITSLPPELKSKTIYTVGLGDKVEGWRGKKEGVRKKHAALAGHAKGGTLGVWSTDLLKGL